jgi:hypothetical protein
MLEKIFFMFVMDNKLSVIDFEGKFQMLRLFLFIFCWLSNNELAS